MSDHLKNGEFYAKGNKIFRAPIETKTDSGTRISVGFPVGHVSDYVDPDNLVECLNASRHIDDLVKALDDLLNDKKTTYAVRCMRARDVLAHVSTSPGGGK